MCEDVPWRTCIADIGISCAGIYDSLVRHETEIEQQESLPAREKERVEWIWYALDSAVHSAFMHKRFCRPHVLYERPLNTW